jgi:hypothetical protein
VATKHSHGPNFGRKVDDCLRCQELAEGAQPVQWSQSRARQDDERRAREIREHDCRASRCGAVCTFGDW